MVTSSKLPRPAPSLQHSTRVQASSEADDVISALVAAGHKKQIATEAAWACGPAERESIEAWMRAALRRCTRGASS